MENLLNALVCSPDVEEDQVVEPFFSWSPCENCNQSLGGNRYAVIYRETLDGEILHADICEDCFVDLCS